MYSLNVWAGVLLQLPLLLLQPLVWLRLRLQNESLLVPTRLRAFLLRGMRWLILVREQLTCSQCSGASDFRSANTCQKVLIFARLLLCSIWSRSPLGNPANSAVLADLARLKQSVAGAALAGVGSAGGARMWKNRLILRNHVDSVRTLAFHDEVRGNDTSRGEHMCFQHRFLCSCRAVRTALPSCGISARHFIPSIARKYLTASSRFTPSMATKVLLFCVLPYV